MNVDRSMPRMAICLGFVAGARFEPAGQRGVAQLVDRMVWTTAPFSASQSSPLLAANSLGAGAKAFVLQRTAELSRLVAVTSAKEAASALRALADQWAKASFSEPYLRRRRAQLKKWQQLLSEPQPRQQSWGQLLPLVLLGQWPNSHQPLRDLDGLTLTHARRFFARHYRPHQAVLTAVGNFDPERFVSLARRRFAAIPTANAGALAEHGRLALPPLPPQKTGRTAVVRSRRWHRGALSYGWAIDGRQKPEHVAWQLVAEVLGGGPGALVYDALLRHNKVKALDVSARTHDLRGHDVLSLYVELPRGVAPRTIAPEVAKQIRSLARRGPSVRQMQRARRRLYTRGLLALQSPAKRAWLLAEYELLEGDAQRLNQRLSRYFTTTEKQVQQAATKLLFRDRTTVVECYPAPIRRDDEKKSKPSKAKQDRKKNGPKKAGGAKKARRSTKTRRAKKARRSRKRL